jgi:hypothetical protein
MNFNYRKVNRIRKLKYNSSTKREPVSFPSMNLKKPRHETILGEINDIPIRNTQKVDTYNFIKGEK